MIKDPDTLIEIRASWNGVEILRGKIQLAHRGELLPRADCWKHIDIVKAQLVAWGILTGRDLADQNRS